MFAHCMDLDLDRYCTQFLNGYPYSDWDSSSGSCPNLAQRESAIADIIICFSHREKKEAEERDRLAREEFERQIAAEQSEQQLFFQKEEEKKRKNYGADENNSTKRSHSEFQGRGIVQIILRVAKMHCNFNIFE